MFIGSIRDPWVFLNLSLAIHLFSGFKLSISCTLVDVGDLSAFVYNCLYIGLCLLFVILCLHMSGVQCNFWVDWLERNGRIF